MIHAWLPVHAGTLARNLGQIQYWTLAGNARSLRMGIVASASGWRREP